MKDICILLISLSSLMCVCSIKSVVKYDNNYNYVTLFFAISALIYFLIGLIKIIEI